MEIFKEFLTSEECKTIIQYIEKNLNSKKVLNHNRNIELYQISKYEEVTFLNEKLNEIGIINNPPFNINKYKEGYYFLPHVDRGGIYDRELKRIKTFVINLSHPSEYNGGNLIVNNKQVDNSQGLAVRFDSGVTHEVTKIQEGIRYSLIMWLSPDNIENFNNTL